MKRINTNFSLFSRFSLRFSILLGFLKNFGIFKYFKNPWYTIIKYLFLVHDYFADKIFPWYTIIRGTRLLDSAEYSGKTSEKLGGKNNLNPENNL